MKQALLIAALVAFATGGRLWAKDVDLPKFVQETQKSEMKADLFRLVWWIPTEYWKESFKNVPTMTQDQKDHFCKSVDDYIVLCVIDGKMVAGNFTSTSRDEITSSLSLTVGQGEKIKPLSDSEVSSDASDLFEMTKPVLARMLGQFGKGMVFVCFKGTDSKGKRILVPTESGSFSVALAGSTYKWRLPLGCLLPALYDPDTGEEFPGNYIYSPFTGKKLVTEKPVN